MSQWEEPRVGEDSTISRGKKREKAKKYAKVIIQEI